MDRDGLLLTKEAYNKMLEAMREAYPAEACGLLAGKPLNNLIDEIFISDNDARQDQNTFYYIDPQNLYRLEREADSRGKGVIGIFHSHPDKPAVLSEEDESRMIPELLYIIGSVTKDGCKEIYGYMKCGADQEVISVTVSITEGEGQ